ncbi:MAG: branched-chain amino acid transport system substrate-binding protein [Solirubrobacteraceae bacterium]
MSRDRWGCGALIAALALGLGACGGSGRRPLRIGVIVDCQGAFRALRDVELSGAQLPLMARGAEPKGREPGAGVTAARVDGRPVELVRGCSESGELAAVTQVARLLVERMNVDVVVEGGVFSVDGIVLREVARRYPDVPFVAAANGPREVTLQGSPASVYRVAADYGQGVAGLATYAYRELGWRKVAVAAEDWVAGWGAETAFVREFCSLGGRVTRRIGLAPGGPPNDPARVPRHVDGVAVLASGNSVTSEYLRALARRMGARRLVLGPEITGDAELLRGAGSTLRGVVGSAYVPPFASSPAVRSYLRDYTRINPGAPASQPLTALVVGYRNAVEAVLQAFEHAHGELSDDRRELRAALGRLRTRLLGVPLRMDAHRQAVVSATLVRLGAPTALQTVAGVDQSIGGLVPVDYVPGEAGQACRRAPPPRWDG